MLLCAERGAESTLEKQQTEHVPRKCGQRKSLELEETTNVFV